MMNRRIKISLVLIIAAFGLLISPEKSFAGITYSNSVVYQTINSATNYGSAVIIGSARVPQPNYMISHGGLATTNAMYAIIQNSLDGINWTSVSTNTFAVTNGPATMAVALGTQSMTVFSRVVIVTTNSVNAGASLTLGATGP